MKTIRALAPLLLVAGGLLLVTNVLPLGRLLLRAVDPEALGWLVESRSARRALRHSLSVSTTVASAATLLALALVLLLERTDLPGRRALRLALFVPLVVPPQILTIAWLGWAGPSGFLQDAVQALVRSPDPLWTLYGPGGIVLLLVVFALPVAYLTLRAGVVRLPGSVEEAARIDGAGLGALVRHVVAPLLLPHALAAFVLAFLAALGNFGIQALLGIPARFLTLPTLIYQRVVSFAPGAFDQAAALALLLAGPALGALGLQWWLLGRRDVRDVETTLEPPRRYGLGRWRWPLAALLMLVVLGFANLGPFGSMLLTALTRTYGLAPTPENLSLVHFGFVLGELDAFPRAARHSLLLAGGAALIAAALAFALGYALVRLRGRVALALQLVIDLPYALPGLVFALALVLVWLRPPIPGLRLYGTVWLLLVAYVGHYLAFAMQPVGASWRQLDRSLEEAAQLDGANLAQRLALVLAPLVAPALAVAALLVFLNAVSELSLSALLVGSGNETLGWLVFSLAQAGFTAQASALSVLLVVGLGGLALLVGLVRRGAERMRP